jgi:hypothetical protein
MIENLYKNTAKLMVQMGLRNFVSMRKIRRALAKQDSMPVPVGIMAKDRDHQKC